MSQLEFQPLKGLKGECAASRASAWKSGDPSQLCDFEQIPSLMSHFPQVQNGGWGRARCPVSSRGLGWFTASSRAVSAAHWPFGVLWFLYGL